MSFFRQRLIGLIDTGLTKEEREVVRETFEVFDKDADGYLSPQELKRCLEGCQRILLLFFTLFRARSTSN